jgi:crotonobetainyl-CoA:carnitine CoA-transferase CaiB-like acyl-CoA transferase
MCRVVAGPTISRLLGDLGAEVIKVDGDPNRARTSYDEPLFHAYLNRGKRGLMLDLALAEDRATFDALLVDADVLVTNVPVGRADAARLTPRDLYAVNPSIVLSYVNLYGSVGSLAEFRGYAETANCATGVASLSAGWESAPSGAPPVNNPPWPYTDSMAGVLGAFGTVAALFDRARRGNVFRTSSSLSQAALLEQMPFAVDSPTVDPARGRDISSATYGIYETRDEPVFVAISPEDLPAVLERVGASSITDLARAAARLSADEIVGRLTFHRSSATRIAAPGETMDPQGFFARRGLRLERHSPDFGTVITQGPVMRFGRTPAVAGFLPTVFGEDPPDGWSRPR